MNQLLYTYIPFWGGFPSHLGHPRALSGRRQWHPTPVLLPGKSHGWRSLVGCGPWGYEESDMTERLPFHFSLSCIGEGNGNPLQCSCEESGTWWAAVYGVTQSWSQLKRLSSSSSNCRIKWKIFHFEDKVESRGSEILFRINIACEF